MERLTKGYNKDAILTKKGSFLNPTESRAVNNMEPKKRRVKKQVPIEEFKITPYDPSHISQVSDSELQRISELTERQLRGEIKNIVSQRKRGQISIENSRILLDPRFAELKRRKTE